LNTVEKFDWNALAQKLLVFGFWAIAFSMFVSLARTTIGGRPRSVSSILLPPVLVVGVALALGFVSARLHRWIDDPWLHHGAALDRYATADTSFRLLYEWMIDHPGADPQFASFLQTNTNIPHWAVPASVPDIALASADRPQAVRPPHVFWFVIDSLRRDYVSAYNPRVTFTPNLGSFARDSLVFTNAFTRYGGTSMAVPSMWAGGLLLHSAYHPPFHPVNALEKLIDAGGYQPLLTLDHIMAPLLTRSTALIEVNRGLETMKFDMCNTVSDLELNAERARLGPRPLFSYALIETLHISLVFNRPVPPGQSYAGFYGPVAAEARRLDGCFGRFIEYLKRSGLYEDSVVVVTADHGDALGDNGAWGHGVRMAPEVMRVPLIVHVPARLRPHVVADLGAVALSTDIAPTLYELAGFEARNAGPLFGTPVIATSEARLDRDRRRRPFLLAASYAATYGMLRNNGRLMYVADVVNGREYQFDMAEGLLGRQVDVTDDDRRLNRQLIREQVTQLDDFYHYTPKAWNMRR
jgi:Sulfatase